MIKDAEGREVFRVQMRGKSFALNMLEEDKLQYTNKTAMQCLGTGDWVTFIMLPFSL